MSTPKAESGVNVQVSVWPPLQRSKPALKAPPVQNMPLGLLVFASRVSGGSLQKGEVSGLVTSRTARWGTVANAPTTYASSPPGGRAVPA